MAYGALALREVADRRYGSDPGRPDPTSDEQPPLGSLHLLPPDGPARQISPDEHTPEHAGDDDVLEALGDEIATLAAHIHAATHRLLVLIARFDRLRGWEPSGELSCAHWLHARTGIDLGAAREKVRTARALESLPLTGSAMARGELSFSKVRALTRIARSDNESDLLELASGANTAQLERMVRAWKRSTRQEEAERERALNEARTFAIFPTEDGMYAVRGLLPPEIAAVWMRAVDAASDALFREQRVPGLSTREESERAAAQRRCDAIGLIAERALAAGFGNPECRCDAHAPEESPCDCEADCGGVPVSGSRAERYQVILHVDEVTLSEEGEPARSELEDGTRVSAETSRRLSCDSSVVRVTHRKDGSLLDVGRKRRTVSAPLRRALEVRDRGCRFPGCGRHFTDGHHLRHWADGGETSLANCLLLCRFHHRLVHEGGWRIEWWGAGRPMFYSPRGEMRFDGSWKPPVLTGDPVDDLIAENRDNGVNPGAWTASARWKREGDFPDEVRFRASEAL